MHISLETYKSKLPLCSKHESEDLFVQTKLPASFLCSTAGKSIKQEATRGELTGRDQCFLHHVVLRASPRGGTHLSVEEEEGVKWAIWLLTPGQFPIQSKTESQTTFPATFHSVESWSGRIFLLFSYLGIKINLSSVPDFTYQGLQWVWNLYWEYCTWNGNTPCLEKGITWCFSSH